MNAWKVFQAMQQHGLTQDGVACSALISACEKGVSSQGVHGESSRASGQFVHGKPPRSGGSRSVGARLAPKKVPSLLGIPLGTLKNLLRDP